MPSPVIRRPCSAYDLRRFRPARAVTRTPLRPVLLLDASHDQRREDGLIEDEEHQQHEPRNDSPCDHEYHACGHEERPEEGIEAHAKR